MMACFSWASERVVGVVVAGMVMVFGVLGVGCSVTVERTLRVDAPEPLRLLAVDVENFDGDVVVRAVRGAGVRADAFVTVSTELEREERARFVEGVDVELSVEEAAPGVATVRVRTSSAFAGDERHAVRVELIVPRADGVRVVNSGGAVELVDVGGRIEVANSGGAVFVRTSRVLREEMLVLNAGGDVFVQVPDGSEGRIRLESLDGDVHVLDSFTKMTETDAGRSLLTTTLDGGENLVDLRTSEGTVRYLVMEDPVGHTRALYLDVPNVVDVLNRQTMNRRYKQNLPDGDVPGDPAESLYFP